MVCACLQKLSNTHTKVIGVELEQMDAMNQSLKSGKRQIINIRNQGDSFAEGILVSEIGMKNFDIAYKEKLKVCTVIEAEIKDAIQRLSYYNNIKSEGAGAATLECALKYQKQDKSCVCIISGGNIDNNIYEKNSNNIWW